MRKKLIAIAITAALLVTQCIIPFGFETASAESTVFSVPEGAADGQLNMTLMGNTYTNLLGNDGDCEDTNKYNIYQSSLSLDDSNKVFGTKSIRITTIQPAGSLIKSFEFKPNTTYFLSGYIKNGNASSGIRIVAYNGNRFTNGNEISDTTKFTRVGIKFTTEATVTSGYIAVDIIDTVSGKYGYVDGLMLTEISNDNLLTNDELLNKYQYVNKTQSVNALRIKSVGKNLVRNGNGEDGTNYWTKLSSTTFSYNIDRFTLTSPVAYGYAYQKIKVKKNTNYSILAEGITNGHISVNGYDGYDGDAAWQNTELASINNTSNVKTFNTGDYSLVYIYLTSSATTNQVAAFNKVMLVEGNTAPTSYESYKESSAYLPSNISLNSIGNVKDEINIGTRQYTKKISDDVTLDGSLSWSNDYSGCPTNSKSVYTSKNSMNWVNGSAKTLKYNGNMLTIFSDSFYPSVDSFITNNNGIGICISNLDSGFSSSITPTSSEWSAYFYGWKMCNSDGSTPYNGSGTKYWKHITDGAGLTSTLPTSGYTGYTPYKLLYQLAAPITTKLNIPPVNYYFGGTVYTDNAIKDTASYNNGITVNQNLPIKSVESVYKIDGSNMTLVDPAKVTVSSNGLSFTITGASNAEQYQYIYNYESCYSAAPTIKLNAPIVSFQTGSTENSVSVTGSAIAGSGLAINPYHFKIGTFDNGWGDANSQYRSSLPPNTLYPITFEVKDNSGKVSTYTKNIHTKADAPSLTVNALQTSALLTVTDTNPDGTQYQITCDNKYVIQSGTLTSIPTWITLKDKKIKVTGLTAGKTYNYTIKARNGDGVETAVSSPLIIQKPSTVGIGMQGVKKVIGGACHTLILKDDGTVWAYGNNSYGQLGDGTTCSRGAPVKINGLSNIVDIATFDLACYAVQNDGALWAWGDNSNGQLGDGTTLRQLNPIKIGGISNVKSIAASCTHVLALKNDGTVWAWGNNDVGQLGNNSTVRSYTPIQVPGLTNVEKISAGGYHSVAIKSDGTVWTWGYNAHGQIGDGTTNNRLIPYQIPSLSGITAVSCGYYHNIALKNDGTVWVWGANYWYQLGDGSSTNRIIPVQIPTLSGITSVYCGGFHSFATKNDGSFWTWGFNNYGQLCDGSTNNKIMPTLVSNLKNVKSVGFGEFSTRILTDDGRVLNYGMNSYGQLGQGELMKINIFKPIEELTGLNCIDSGLQHAIALKNDGTVWVWGNNFNYQLCFPGEYYKNKAQQVLGLSDIKSIAAGYYHSIVLKNDGTVLAWGLNSNGQLGDGTTDPRFLPLLVQGLNGITKLAAGSMHNVALKSDGTVWTWGYNGSGQLGDGTTTNRTIPLQVSGLTGVKAIEANGDFTAALKNDGTVWVWGNNRYGQLGDGTKTNKLSPIQISDLSDITSIALGAYSLIALKNDGTLWECGTNGYGQLGDGSNVDKNQPTKNPLINNVKSIFCNNYTTFATKNDGTVWCWGWGQFGQLGDGGYANKNKPFQITGINNIKMFSGGNTFSYALKADGTVLSCGDDTEFLLGNGNRLLNSTIGLPLKGGQVDNIKTTTASRSITLTWDAADGAQSYDVEVDGTVVTNVTSTGYTATGLNSNVTHQFMVRSKNELVTGDWSQPIIVSKGPAAPANINTTPGRGSVTLTWNSVKGATGYDIEVDGTVIYDVQSPYKDIQNGAVTVHKYRIRAKSENGTGDWSQYVMESPLPPLPQPPADITLTPTGTTVKISWNTGADATGYDIESDGDVIGSCKVVSGSCITSYTQKGLCPLTSHTYRVRSKNAAGIGDWSRTYTATTTEISITTAPAISVKEENISDTYALINWSEIPDASNYDIVETTSTTDGAIIDNGNVTTCRLQGFAPGSTHTYKVRAKNGTAVGPWSAPVTITTNILATPENIKADKYDTSIKLKWDQVPGASGYELKLNGTLIPVAATTYSAIGLTPDTEYIYQVRAIGAGGNSGWSIEYKTKTLPQKPAAPANVKAAVSDTVITMTWDGVLGAVGYDVELNGVLLENDTSTMYINSELKPNTAYTYRVRTRSSYMESDWSSFQTIKTLAGQPVAPKGITVVSTQTSATISWAAADGTIDYDLEIDDGTNPSIIIQHLTETSYTHRRLEPETQYSYRLRTRNEEGISSWSGYIINNAMMTKCTKNNTVDLGLTAADVTDFTPYTMVVTYNTGVINVADLCTLTGQTELKAGRIEGTDITITEFKPGRIVFVVDKVINPGESWTGVIENIKFKAKQTGGTTITYTVLCKSEEE